jgi:GH35 family endo-1,4-beta-xylanase
MPYTDIIKASTAIASLPMYDDLSRTWELMGTKEIKVDVELPGVLNCPVGSYIVFKGEQYTVNTVPSVTKGIDNGVLLYKYTITFESLIYRLYDKKLRHLNNRTFQEFGNPAKYAQLVVDNINEIDPGWTVGVCDDVDPKTINFSGHTCRTALDTIAEAFGLEWDVTVKVIRFTKQVGKTTGYTFRYGQGLGLYSLSYAYQNDKNIVTRAYGYGSTRNLPEDYRAGATQLMFAEGHLDANVDLYGVKEGDYENEDIYPEVAGVISDAPAWVPGAGTFTVKDDSLTFNLNDYKSVETPKLSFTSGELQGQDFDILDYFPDTKTYKLKVFQDGNTLSLPNETFGAQPGDTYTLFDMPLPTELVTAAEVKLKAATQEWLNTNSKPQVLYSLELDPLYAREHNIMLEPGDRVTIIDTALGINELIRVSKVSYPTNFPEYITPSTKITIEIANFIPYTLTERVISDIKDTKAAVKTTISKTNYYKRMIEYVKTISGVDYLPPNTAIIDPATGTITANLINADFVVARNLITNKVKITAANNNIIIEDDNENAIIIMDDTASLDGVEMKSQPPIDHPDGSPDPDYLYSQVVSVNGVESLYYFYAVRGPGFRVGLSTNNSAGFSSMGRKGLFTSGQYIAGGNKKTLVMDRDGFKVNSGKRTVSGQFDTPIDGTTQLTLRTTIENGLIVGSETLNKANLPAPAPITVNNTTTLPPDSSNDTGYVPNDGTGGVVLTPAPTPTTLKAKFPFNTGIAFKEALINDTDYGNIVKDEFDQMTPENACKFGTIRPDRATFNFTRSDAQFNWAKTNGLKIHLHYLFPGGDDRTPQWFLDMETLPNAAVEVEAEVRLHVKTVLQHVMNGTYAGMVVSIDIVNECLTSGGSVKDSMLKRLLGEQYFDIIIDECGKWAPGIPLLENDFDFEYNNSKINGAIGLRSRIASRGYTLDGIGSQMHSVLRLMTEGLTDFRNRIQMIADSGMILHISELDVRCKMGTNNVNQGDYPFMTPALEADQAQFFVRVYQAVIDLMPANKLLAVTEWSLDDDSNFENIPTHTDYTSIWYRVNNVYTKRLAHQALLGMASS